MKNFITVLLFVFLSFIVFTIHLKNPELITFNYYFNIQVETYISLIVAGSFIAGIILGWFIMLISVFKSKRQMVKAKKELTKVEKEVENLRTMPIKDEV